MTRYLSPLLFLLFLIPQHAFADVRLAVLEFRGNASKAILQQISDEARGGVREGLPRQKYSITSRENIKQILDVPGCLGGSLSCEIVAEGVPNSVAHFIPGGVGTRIEDWRIIHWEF